MKTIDVIAAALLVVGGLNWGLIGAFDFNLVSSIFGIDSVLSNAIYVLVGLAALYQAVGVKFIQKRWHMRPRIGHDSHTANV